MSRLCPNLDREIAALRIGCLAGLIATAILTAPRLCAILQTALS